MLRFLTGASLSLVYPPSLKVCGWRLASCLFRVSRMCGAAKNTYFSTFASGAGVAKGPSTKVSSGGVNAAGDFLLLLLPLCSCLSEYSRSPRRAKEKFTSCSAFSSKSPAPSPQHPPCTNFG